MTSTPPLLMLAEGRRPRPRKAAVPRPKELALHLSVVRLLRIHGRPAWRWTHIPSGEKREPRMASKLKMMGVARGWPDIVMVSPDGRFHGLELKRKGGRLSEDQAEFLRWAAAHGIPFSCADNFQLAVAILKHWGAIPEGVHV